MLEEIKGDYIMYIWFIIHLERELLMNISFPGFEFKIK